MGRAWYVLQAISGMENKVVERIKEDVLSRDEFKKIVINIKIPMENVEVKNPKTNQKVIKKQRVYPGYVLMELDFPQDELLLEKFMYAIKNIRGVIGFLGAKSMKKPPRPLSIEEVRTIFERIGEFKSKAFLDLSSTFEVGDQVRITDGPFKGLVGKVVEVHNDKFKMKVMVEIFSRETPVNISFDQAERV
jgi:transcriptional antiterminator NusG